MPLKRLVVSSYRRFVPRRIPTATESNILQSSDLDSREFFHGRCPAALTTGGRKQTSTAAPVATVISLKQRRRSTEMRRVAIITAKGVSW